MSTVVTTIAELSQTVEQEAEKRPAPQRLRTHPWGGRFDGTAFVLIIGDEGRFHCGKQITSYWDWCRWRSRAAIGGFGSHHQTREFHVALSAGGSGSGHGAQRAEALCPACESELEYQPADVIVWVGPKPTPAFIAHPNFVNIRKT